MEFIDFGSLIPVVAILSSLGFAWIWLRHRQLAFDAKRMEHEAQLEGVEKRRLEQRLAVLERIVTDRGIQTAEQIDALRERPTENAAP